VPTLAERLDAARGMIMFSNVSPGAAYAHDPDRPRPRLHRRTSRRPQAARGRAKGSASPRRRGRAGAMTSRFIDEVLVARKPALAICGWATRPTQHTRPLGRPSIGRLGRLTPTPRA